MAQVKPYSHDNRDISDFRYACSYISPALTSSIDLKNITYIFYYNATEKLSYLKGTDKDGYKEYLVLTDQSDPNSTVTGRLDTLSATLWDDEEASNPPSHK
jgi:hypothetical protein